MAVSTRFTIAFVVARRLGELLQRLRDEIAASGRVDELLDRRYAYTPRDSLALYDLCGAVDAFFFEYRSAYEVIRKFILKFGEHILDRAIPEEELREALANAGANTDWIDPLRVNRNFFIHNTAPWIALRVDRRHPLEGSLVIMKRHLDAPDNPEDYVTQAEVVATIKGFQVATWKLRDWLLDQIDDAEAKFLSSQS